VRVTELFPPKHRAQRKETVRGMYLFARADVNPNCQAAELASSHARTK
jgi:hypothetical protein